MIVTISYDRLYYGYDPYNSFDNWKIQLRILDYMFEGRKS